MPSHNSSLETIIHGQYRHITQFLNHYSFKANFTMRMDT